MNAAAARLLRSCPPERTDGEPEKKSGERRGKEHLSGPDLAGRPLMVLAPSGKTASGGKREKKDTCHFEEQQAQNTAEMARGGAQSTPARPDEAIAARLARRDAAHSP
jgi:hypothetical protein